jgi:predicted transposase YdaD
MAKPFDIALKDLLDLCAPDWVRLFAADVGIPATAAVVPLEVELTADPLLADKVFRLQPPQTGILHIEPQASWDGKFAERLHAYNAALDVKYGHPVYTVAVLLRPDANSPRLTGELLRHRADGRRYLAFEYTLVRVWELAVDDLLAGGIGILPLALLTDDARGRLGDIVDRIDDRLTAGGVSKERRERILTDGFILSGLRYNDAEIERAFLRARGMKESTTYQMILREGRAEGLRAGLEKGREEGRQEGRQEGQLDAARGALLGVLRARFGTVPPAVHQRIEATTDAAALQALVPLAVTVADPLHLPLAAPPPNP